MHAEVQLYKQMALVKMLKQRCFMSELSWVPKSLACVGVACK